MKRAANLELGVVLAGLAVYLVLFFATPLPSLRHEDDSPWRRAEFFQFLLLPETLAERWFGGQGEWGIADRLPIVLWACTMLGVSAAAGWIVLRLLGADCGLTRLETLVFSAAVGLNLLSTFILVLGLLGLLHHAVLVWLLPVLVLAVFGSMHARRWHAALAQAWRGLRATKRLGVPGTSASPSAGRTLLSRPSGPRPSVSHGRPTSAQVGHGEQGAARAPYLPILCGTAAALFGAVIVLGGMLPPGDFDVLEYHLQVPKEFFSTGRIAFLPHNVYGNMPLGAEMLALWSMVLTGDWWTGALVGKTMLAAFAPLTALGLLAAGRRLLAPKRAALPPLLYLSTPWVVQVSTTGLIDGAVACYGFLAVYAVLLALHAAPTDRAKEANRQLGPRVLLAGYLAGSAVACKYPAAVFVALPLGLWIAWAGWPKRRWAVWKPVAAFLLAAVVGCGLWYGKNWVLAGNPTYPLLYDLLGGNTWTPEKNQRWKRVHGPPSFAPVAMMSDAGRVVLTSEWLGPVVVPLAAMAVLMPGRRRTSLGLAVYVAYYLAVWWLATHRIDRFLVPLLPVVSLMAGAGASTLDHRVWRRVLGGVVALAALWGLLVATTGPGGSNRYFVRLDCLRTDPERVKPSVMALNRYCRGGRVLMVGEAAVFDLQMPVLYNTCFDDCVLERLLARARSPAEAQAALTAAGITHVYVDWAEIDRYRSPGNYGYSAFVSREVFDNLENQGVLKRSEELAFPTGQGYFVLGVR